jgi:hypothetical protein
MCVRLKLFKTLLSCRNVVKGLYGDARPVRPDKKHQEIDLNPFRSPWLWIIITGPEKRWVALLVLQYPISLPIVIFKVIYGYCAGDKQCGESDAEPAQGG